MNRIIKTQGIKVIIYSYLIFQTAQLSAQIRYVPEEYNTIQQAIQAAESGDTVLVNDGFYQEQVNFLGKNIVVASWYLLDQDSSHIYNTEINRSYLDEGVLINSGEGPSAQLIGFLISNCKWEAVSCEDSSPTIRHNIIKGNAATGLYVNNSAAIVSDNEIHGYPGNDLGGPCEALRLYNSGPVIERNVIIEDENFNVHAIELGLSNLAFPGISIIIRDNLVIGGIFGSFPKNGLPQLVHHNIFIPGRESSSAMNVTGCGEGFRIFNNTVVGGYGIWIQHGDYADIRNNLVAFANSGIWSSIDTVTIAYNNIWQCGDNYRGLYDYTGENGNISADPGLIDPENGNYHYYCWSACIDAGDPEMDFSLEPSPNGGRINIGRYGNTVEADKSVACYSLKNEIIDFGFIPDTIQKDSLTYIYSAGHAPLSIYGMTHSDGSNFSLDYPGGTITMLPGDSLPLTISFHPSMLASSYADSIIITSNSGYTGRIHLLGESNVGIHQELSHEDFEVFPVPVTGQYLYLRKVDPRLHEIKVEIISVSGNIVYSELIHPYFDNIIRLDLMDLSDGVYCLVISFEEDSFSHKFIRMAR